MQLRDRLVPCMGGRAWPLHGSPIARLATDTYTWPMRDILATNDPVVLSFAEAILRAAGISAYVADVFTAGIEGSIGIFPRRLRVHADDVGRARTALFEAGLGDHLAEPAP